MKEIRERIHPDGGKRLILIVDDEAVNRELLGVITQNDYEAIYATNGEEAMKLMRENADVLSLVLLDLIMPGMSGFDVLEKVRIDPELSEIPIVVLSSEESEEIKSLAMGAMDFVGKPFSVPAVVVARMQKAIELNERRKIIRSTEREEQTGLFTKEFFFSYCEEYDIFHPDQPMDAIVLDINHFTLINEMYGREKSDEVLMQLAEHLKELSEETGCIVSHVQGDEFFIYSPSGVIDYVETSQLINSHYEEYQDINVRVRSGIYLNADKSIEIERRFDRASQASSLIRENYSKLIAYYDAMVHEQAIMETRLLGEAYDAIDQGQFYLNFQPKYSIRGTTPRIISAEVLARWKHPHLGQISPADFIPLLENNGMIQRLDGFVWQEALRCAGEWKKAGIGIPLSINVSRMDLYNSNLVQNLDAMLKKNGLERTDLLLEITESAYSENPEQLVAAVQQLHDAGYRLEMDDFGTGYSSLVMLADSPIEVVKMDMLFMQNLKNDKQMILIRMIMDIAKRMGLNVVAEGVETKEQVDFLRTVNCDIIQGYYFSRPLSQTDFEELLNKNRIA